MYISQGARFFTRLPIIRTTPLHRASYQLHGGGRHTTERCMRFGALISAPIATATIPNLAAASKKTRKRRSSKLNHTKGVDYRNERKNRIEKLKEQLAVGEDEAASPKLPSSLELAPAVKASPPPFRTYEEFSSEFTKFELETKLERQKLWDITTLMRIHKDLERIKQGGLTRNEERFFLQEAIKVVESSADRRRLQQVLQFWRSEDFEQRLLEAILWVSDDTKVRLSQALKPPPEDFEPIEHRLENVFLAELPPFARRQYRKRKADILYSVNGFWSNTVSGPSMLPSVPNPSRLVGFPITEKNVHQVRVGNVVACVVQSYPEANARRVLKRVRALGGDIVDFKGTSVRVPQGHCWLVGDNEAQSFDSRHYGAVPLANIRSRGLVAFSSSWPFVRILL